MTDRLYRMPIGDFLRRRPEATTCQACGSPLPSGAIFCPSCGVRADDPQAEPLHIVDRTTGLFNERFVRPVLEDELAQSFSQHPIADARDARQQLIEPSRCGNQSLDNCPGPALTD